MKLSIKAIIVAMVIGIGGISEARTIRATEMTPEIWEKIKTNPAETLIVEFDQGDQLPVNISAMGDLIQSPVPGAMSVTVQKNFWLMLQGNNVQISLDGTTFKAIKDMVTGGISADAMANNSGGAANIINVVFAAYLK